MDDNRDEPGTSDERNKIDQKYSFENKQASSSPIEIKQSSSGSKARLSPDANGFLLDPNGEPVPLDKIIKTANTMSSIMMAHKIALEDDFKLEQCMDLSGPLMSLSPIIGSSPSRNTLGGTQISEPNLQNRVKDIVHEAYWDLFKEELITQGSMHKEEKKYDISQQLLRDLKQKILELLLPQHTRLKEEVEYKFDSEIINKLVQLDSLNLVEYAKYTIGVLSKLCAPVRDEKLKELSDTTDVVQLYRGIMEVLELMRLDFANFTLNRFKPHIKAHSQEYEREKFNEILKQQQSIGIDGLEYTRMWLTRAAKRVDSIHGLEDMINESEKIDVDSEELNQSMMASNVGNNSKSYSVKDKILKSDIINKVLNAGYCELLDWSYEEQKLYPETLLFDQATFNQLSKQYKVLVLTSSILLTTFALLNRIKLSDSDEFKTLIKSHVITLLTASYDSESTDSSEASILSSSQVENLDQVKLETIVTKLTEDIKQRIEKTDRSKITIYESQCEIFKRQILELHSSSNRIKELATRRILEFVETLLTLDVEHQRKKFVSKSPPPVNIPLGLNCLANEITLTMAQLVKIVRYNRRVFFHHYEKIIVEVVSKML